MKIFVIGTVPETENRDDIVHAFERLGASMADRHEIVVCSPYEKSADVSVMRGAAKVNPGTKIEIHYPETPDIKKQLETLRDSLGLTNLEIWPVAPSGSNAVEGDPYSWLLPQLAALDRCHAVIALGGNPDGAANLLLRLAESRQIPILPVSYLGGASAACFLRQQYRLTDRLSNQVSTLHEISKIDLLPTLAEKLADGGLEPGKLDAKVAPSCFISYASKRPNEADFIETALRRRNIQVYRDEHDFGAGHQILDEIREAIHKCNVFIAVWCQEYACSPWCYDELELALKRQAENKLELWIFSVDDTRLVPPEIRKAITYPVNSRKEIDGVIGRLIATR